MPPIWPTIINKNVNYRRTLKRALYQEEILKIGKCAEVDVGF
jgi:hypothetical protein